MIDLFQPGAYARAAGGNLERPDIQAPVVRWMAWSINPDNGGGGSTTVWDRCRALWKANGIQDFPWLHCRSIADVERLIRAGEVSSSPAIGLNIEDVVTDKLSLQEVAGVVQDFWVLKYDKPVHMPTLAWVQNGQGWQWMEFAVAALEIFPDENEASKHPQDCIDHAFAEGLTKVTLMLKTKPPNTRLTYGTFFSICHSLYTADDITPDALSWQAWKAPAPCDKLTHDVPLTPVQAPYTGPYYGPSNLKGPMKGPTAKALKRFGIRMGVFSGEFATLDDHYNLRLENAMKKFQGQVGIQRSGQYGKQTWDAVRAARVPSGPHKGEYALDSQAQKLIRDEWASDQLTICYPVPLGQSAFICQGLHRTAGDTTFAPNWAIDFCASPGTDIVAVEAGVVTKLSGRDPDGDIPDASGVFGWSIHYETAQGYHYYLTHLGKRVNLTVNQNLKLGQVLGQVGDQDFRPDHIHLGVTSPKGEVDAKATITKVSQAPKVVEL